MRILKSLKLDQVLLVLLIVLGLITVTTVHAAQSPQGIWSEISLETLSANGALKKDSEKWVNPDRFRSFDLNHGNLQQILAKAPLESPGINAQFRAQPVLIYLPTPDGDYLAFEFVESPVMASELAAKFPEIKTYSGVSVEDPSITARFDYTPKGFHAQVLAPGKRWYIDPHFKGDTNIYASYYKQDYRPVNGHSQCLLKSNQQLSRSAGLAERSGDILRTYRLAVATTGEYSAFHGGTVAGALAAVVTTVNRVTGIYEKELAIRLSLIGSNNTIIFTDPATDPFTGNFDANILIDESQTAIDNAIGSTNYDIGHTFSTGAGGLAGLGVVCNGSQKARGVTGRSQPVGDAFDVDFVAHEIGHQFGGNHTFNGTIDSCSGTNRNGPTAYEPGSGSTIQAYAGICGSDNLQNSSDPIFHSESHAEIMSYIAAGGSCSSNATLSNSIPAANAGADYTIPVQTPFVLTGSGTDADGDTLTYLWEERDLGSQSALNAADDGQIPLFRVFTPSTEPMRYLPRLTTLVGNSTDNAEKIPQVARPMTWRLTVRDNKGGVESDDAQVTVSASAGPFQLINPNGGESLSGATTVNWNVANTSSAPVSAANVDIYLSTDGGLTYDTANPLLANTPNDGSQSVTLPNIDTTQARIMVKGAGNIFFDISDQNFSITSVTSGGGASGGTPSVSSPAANSTLSGSSQTFNWTANGATVSEWWLYVGSTPGGFDYHDSGSLGSSLSTTVTGLPTDGSTVHVRLWYRANASAAWQFINVQYTASVALPGITSPTPGGTLSGSTQTFKWTTNGAAVSEWWLYVGSTPGGFDYHDSGSLGSSLSTTVTGLPTDGSTVHARLWYRANASAPWQFIDVQYTASVTLPGITSPTPGGTLSGSTQAFNWTANGAAVSEWWLYVGSTPGGFDYHDSGSLGSSLSTTVTGLPTDGSTVYVRLWYRANASAPWQFIDVQYTANGASPGMTSPAPGSTLASSQTFTWTANGANIVEWWLYVGTTQGGSQILDSGSLGSSLSTTVTGLPTDGSTVHVRLWYRVSGVGWQATDIQYTASSANDFNVTETQFINSSVSGACTGDDVAAINLSNATNNLTVDVSFAGDLDLGVLEPDGSCLWWANTSSANGGSFSGDVVFGGTESYTITNGPVGTYSVLVHYHDVAQNADVHIFGSGGTPNLAAKSATNTAGRRAFKENK